MWYTLFFAALLGADSIGIGLALGTKRVKIPIRSGLAVMVISSGFAAVGCFVGVGSGALLGEAFCKIFGGVLMTVAGAVLLRDALKGGKEDSDRDGSGEISVKEAVLMGIALSSDIPGAGIGFACGEKDIWMFPIFVGMFQLCFLFLGDFAGGKIKVPLWIKEKIIPYIPPFVIMAIGVAKCTKWLF